MKDSKKIIAAIAAVLAISAVPCAALACCEYDAEKDAYVCGGNGAKDGNTDAITNGGGCGGGGRIRSADEGKDSQG